MSETTRKILLSLRARTMMECSKLVQIPANLSANDIEEIARRLHDRFDGSDFQEDPEYWERSDPNWETVDWQNPPDIIVVPDSEGEMGAMLLLSPLQYWRRTLTAGLPVFWDDPDRHLSSGDYVITSINSDGDIADDTIISVHNDAGSSAEVLPIELYPARPDDLLDVVFNGEVVGMATTEASATDLVCAGDPDEEGYLAEPQENVVVADVLLAKAWVVRKCQPQPDEALLMHLDTALRMVVDVKYHCNGVSNRILRGKLEAIVHHAMSDGLLTGGTAAEVAGLDMTVMPFCNPLSEDALANFMLQRIEDGDLALADIPIRLARYGLMDPAAFNAEMRERMEMRGFGQQSDRAVLPAAKVTPVVTDTPAPEFDQFQKVVLEAYADGQHWAHKPEDIATCGDSLLTFLLVELSESEDCDSMECAARRIDTAIRQLTALRDVFDAKSGA